ncbi:MAG: fructosamine kinase family protein, partial [Burkholderiales bacterium]
MYAAEAEGLAALRAAGVRAPEPYAHGVRGGEAYLEMEHLDLGGPADWPAMARMLASLHRHVAGRYGWPRDNWIGLAPQKNGEFGDWIGFWRERRLQPQLELARSNGHRFDAAALLDRVAGFFKGYTPLPSLLHGDLWSGNAGFLAGGAPVLFDPAVYYGDREADLAMSELFGGYPREFYAAYREAWPLDSGYEMRKPLYNLYHLLNHLNLFGSGYLRQVQTTLS